MSKPMVTLTNWSLSSKYIEGVFQDSWGRHEVEDRVLDVMKESDDVIIVEGEDLFYKLDPPWRMR